MRNYKIYHNIGGFRHIKFVKYRIVAVFNKKWLYKNGKHQNFYYFCNR